MTFRGTSLIQKALLNSLSDDIEYSISQNDDTQANTISLNGLQLNAEQALQLGLKLFENGSESFTNSSSMQDHVLKSTQTISSVGSDIISTENLNNVPAKSNSNIISFVLKPAENNSSLLNRTTQIKPKPCNNIDDINELLSFNDDDEGTTYLQNSLINIKDNNQVNKNIISTQITQSVQCTSTSQPIKYTLAPNASKNVSVISQPIKPNIIVNSNHAIALPGQSLIKNSSLNSKSTEKLDTLKSISAKAPVIINPAKRPINIRSILVNPNGALTTNANAQTQLQPSAINSLLNNQNAKTQSFLSDKTASLIKSNSKAIPKLIKINSTKTSNIDSTYKVEYRLDLDSNSVTSNNGMNVNNTKTTSKDLPTYKIEYILDPQSNSATGNNGMKSVYAGNVFNDKNVENDTHSDKSVRIDINLLNKTVPSNSKLEDSIVPLTNRNKTNIDSDASVLKKAMQKFTVDTNKPLGSTENPIKLLQKGQTFQSLHSLNESQLQQIAGVLKQRPPHQQCGDREPHKVVLYDSETRTRIIYRIVYPDELNLKPADPDSDTNNLGKEKRKRKAKLSQDTTADSPESVLKDNQLPRTRTGRVIRPPNRMLHDFKKLKRTGDDSDEDEWVDAEEIQESVLKSNNLHNVLQSELTRSKTVTCNESLPNSDTTDKVVANGTVGANETDAHLTKSCVATEDVTQNSENTFLNDLPKRAKAINSKFRCPTCNKFYLGYGKMSKHLEMYPDHGCIDDLGIEPKAANVPKYKARRKQRRFTHSKSKPNHSASSNSDIFDSVSDNSDKDNTDLFSGLITKVMAKDNGIERWQIINDELKNFIEKVEHFIKDGVLKDFANDAVEVPDGEEGNMINVNETISRLVDLKPGCYKLKESFMSSHNNTTEQKTSSPNTINKLLENTITSMQENKSNLSNNSIDLDMLCSTEPVFEKDDLISNKTTTLQEHMDMLIENDQTLSQPGHIGTNGITLTTSTPNLVNAGNLNAVHSLESFQNVDDLVQESLKNLTAAEIASVPALSEHAVSHSTLQELSLDLFQFHHS